MSERRGRAALRVVALAAGLAYAAITPPDRVPDELGHFYRAVALADGDFFPPVGYHMPGHYFPKGIQIFGYRVLRPDLSARYTLGEMRAAYAEPLNRAKTAGLEFGAWYSPAPYVASAAVAFVGLHAGWRPFSIFYLGRIANLIACLAVVVAAMRAMPGGAALFGAILLLPMTLYQFASWSADAMTIAVAILLTALILRNFDRDDALTNREIATLAAVALFAGLCKPAYFLLMLPVVAIPTARFAGVRRRLVATSVILAAMAFGTALSIANARMERYNPRWDVPVDPAQQLRCIAHDPLHFAALLFGDLWRNGISYLGQAAGRLGMADLPLPTALLIAEWVLLIAVAVSRSVRWTTAARTVAAIACAAMIVGVSVSQYLVWSVICSDEIGLQGRYYLPILPLALFTLSPRLPLPRRVSALVVAAVGVIANGIALYVVFRRYWA